MSHTLPIDELRDGSMTDTGIVSLSAATILSSIEPNWPEASKDVFRAMAARLELVRLIDIRQTRHQSIYRPGAAGVRGETK